MTLFSSSCTQTHLPTMSSHLHIIKYEYYAKCSSLMESLEAEKALQSVCYVLRFSFR